MNSRMRKFFSYYKPYRRLFWADMACALVVSLCTLLLPLCVRFITKQLQAGTVTDVLTPIVLMGGVMVLLVAILTYCQYFVDYQGHLMGAKMESDMRNELFTHYQKLSFRFYDEQKTGQLMTRLTNDSFDMAELYHHGPEDIVISLLNFIGAFIVLMTIDLPLTLVVIAFLPVMVVFAIYFNKKMKVALRRSRDRIGDINAQVEESLAGVRVVKSFANEPVEQQKFTIANDRFLDSRDASYRGEAHFYSGMIGFTELMSVAVVIFGAIAITRTAMDLADLITFLLYIGILIEPIKRFANFTRLYQEGIAGFERFMEMLEVEPEIVDAVDAMAPTTVRGALRFEKVSFGYKAQQQVLNNLSLDLCAGDYVALVGMSGVGKTTLCSLIPRFYEVDSGAIYLDGVDIRSLPLQSLRNAIGIVQQDIYLFAGTIAENIRYGKLDAGRDEIIQAAKHANAHDFIMALPHGYDTDIGERGVKLSGGQKQRISIARVFLKNPPIIIFDEATSSLDNESEKAVQSSLERLAHNRTTIVIAHRLSTVRNAQRIIVLADGNVAEEGTHDELIRADGVYANLYNMQLRI